MQVKYLLQEFKKIKMKNKKVRLKPCSINLNFMKYYLCFINHISVWTNRYVQKNKI